MPTILVVEDEANIRQFVAVNLKARGYDVLQTESAEKGLEILREHTPNALILDIKLPGMSGWSMLNIINTDPTLLKLPTVIMTASSVISQPNEYPYPHIVEKLVKPFALTDLLRVIEKLFP